MWLSFSKGPGLVVKTSRDFMSGSAISAERRGGPRPRRDRSRNESDREDEEAVEDKKKKMRSASVPPTCPGPRYVHPSSSTFTHWGETTICGEPPLSRAAAVEEIRKIHHQMGLLCERLKALDSYLVDK